MIAAIRMLRPHQWVKNAFVAAPLVFAQRLTDKSSVLRTGVAVLAFCLLSGAVYAFNDVRDVAADRRHPTKCRRPVASGQISQRAALVISATLAMVALIGCWAIRWQLAVFAALYLAQNIAYSMQLKRVAYLDVAVIATGFLLRVLAGAAAIHVPASKWLLLCTGELAALLALGKRAHELRWTERIDSPGRAGVRSTPEQGVRRWIDSPGRAGVRSTPEQGVRRWIDATTATRAALAGYKLSTIRRVLPLLSAVTCATYVLYTLAPHTVAMFGTRRLVWSAPFVAIGIGRFLALSLWRPKAEPPTEAMLRDPLIIADVVAATAIVIYAIYDA